VEFNYPRPISETILTDNPLTDTKPNTTENNNSMTLRHNYSYETQHAVWFCRLLQHLAYSTASGLLTTYFIICFYTQLHTEV